MMCSARCSINKNFHNIHVDSDSIVKISCTSVYMFTFCVRMTLVHRSKKFTQHIGNGHTVFTLAAWMYAILIFTTFCFLCTKVFRKCLWRFQNVEMTKSPFMLIELKTPLVFMHAAMPTDYEYLYFVFFPLSILFPLTALFVSENEMFNSMKKENYGISSILFDIRLFFPLGNILFTMFVL